MARVNGEPITEEDFRASLEAQPSFVRQSIRGKTAYLRYFGDMITTELLAQEARKRGMQTDPEVATATRIALVEALWKDVHNQLDLTTVTNEEIRVWIEQQPADRWHKEPKVTFEALFTRDPQRAERLWLALSMVHGSPWPSDLARGVWYDKIFRSWSEKEWPELGPIGLSEAGKLAPEPLIRAALDAELFRVTRPVETEAGYYLVVSTSRVPSEPMTEQEKRAVARASLIEEQQKQARLEIRQQVLENASVEILDPAIEGALDKLPRK